MPYKQELRVSNEISFLKMDVGYSEATNLRCELTVFGLPELDEDIPRSKTDSSR